MSGLRSTHLSFEIADASSVAFARRGAGEAAQSIGFSETDAGRLALVVTEASTNILKHAGHGELLVRVDADGPASGVEITALDSGPGIEDLRRAFDDGSSTAGTAGTGLGAIKRLSDELAVYSQPRLGTVLRAVVRSKGQGGSRAMPAYGMDIGGICTPLRGEVVSGDAWSVESDQDGLTITVADGLGHGPEAREAAVAALEVAYRRAGRAPATLMELAHGALRSTRGAAVAISRLDLVRSVLSFCGTGNISAVAFGIGRPLMAGERPAAVPEARESWQLSSRNGIVGHAMRDAQQFDVAWPRNALLVLHSDGVATRWSLSAYPGLYLQPAALIAAVIYRDFSRRRDDATVVVVKAAPGVEFAHEHTDIQAQT
ncbi:SpoIIE family protein phosphatase [Azoarcus indigens]|uniref:Anti-sigma regulatory factor (Ser/Thr protein kinase) n=1 Tax=Azoarcus indigens TaxID=29545 RepID=A0A4R6DMB4_9RHOO|nr:SpoIIE family protein phosphatase [Azoarcus indigens]TDN46021.1 anti-sigma regulatory factor (Ser/Thr protein kinase) [Azoarcus indigens]